MSTLLKKKGAASFKPRAPVRRPAAPPKPAASSAPVVASEAQAAAPTLEQDKPLPSIESPAIEPPSQNEPQPEPSIAAVAAPALPTPAPTQDSSTTISAAENFQSQPEISGTTLSTSVPPTASSSVPAAAAPAKARPRRVARKNVAAPSAPAPELASEPESTPAPAVTHEYPDPEEVHGLPHLMPQAQMSLGDGPSTESTPAPGPARLKRVVKRKISSAFVALDDDGEQPSIEQESPEPEVRATKTARKSSVAKKPRKAKSATVDPDAPPKKRGGRKREPTPEGAEEIEIDHTTIKMSELTKDMRIGKKFSRHDEIEKRDADRKARLKARRENPNLTESDDDRRRPKRRTRTQTEEPPVVDVSGAGPRMRLVDGQIVIDETSLNLDRHKIAAANAGIMEIVQEDEFTHLTTSATYMKREKNKFWDYEAEQKFYNGLRQFGTDFEMISMLFKDRSRRHIKLKYNKEERVNPERITAALIHEKAPIDFEKYQTETGLEFIEPELFNKELEDVDKKHAEQEALVDAEMAETIRKKKAAIHGNGGSEKENEGQQQMRKKGKASKKNKASAYGGGEELEDLGEI